TRGYAHAPGQTAAAYRPDPFAAEPGARMYRSGDLARRLPDGTFEFLGRGDRQVKIPGHPLEPAAVRAGLDGLTPPAPHPPAGPAPPGSPGRPRRAPTPAPPGPPPRTPELTGRGRPGLPPPAAPAAFVSVPKLPMNTAGKLDESALPQPDALPVAAVEP